MNNEINKEVRNREIAGVDFTGLLAMLNLSEIDIKVNIINPVRKSVNGEYETGDLIGIKPGEYGGGWSNYVHGIPQSYDSTKRRWIKKPKVLVKYSVFIMNGKGSGKTICDWIDIDNCKFEIITTKPKNNE